MINGSMVTIYMKWRLADDPCGLPMATIDGENKA